MGYRRFRPILVVLALAAVVAMFVRAVGERSERRAVLDIRDQLGVLRTSVDSCRAALAWEESEFRLFDQRVDSLRGLVSEFEALDDRGVPRERYDDYMEVFDEYNASVEPWQEQADTLEARWSRCRRLVTSHNVVADTLRQRLEALDGG